MATFYGTWYKSTIFPTRVADLKWYGADVKAKVVNMAKQFFSYSEVQKRYPNFPGVDKCVCIAKQVVYKESTWDPGKTRFYLPETPQTAMISATNDRIVQNGHGLTLGSEIKLSSLTGNTTLNNSNIYYVKAPTFYDFKIASSSSGSAIDIPTDGTCQINYRVYGLWQISNVHSWTMPQWPTKNNLTLNTMFNSEYNTRLAFTIMNSAINNYKNPWIDWSVYNNGDSDSPVKICL